MLGHVRDISGTSVQDVSGHVREIPGKPLMGKHVSVRLPYMGVGTDRTETELLRVVDRKVTCRIETAIESHKRIKHPIHIHSSIANRMYNYVQYTHSHKTSYTSEHAICTKPILYSDSSPLYHNFFKYFAAKHIATVISPSE